MKLHHAIPQKAIIFRTILSALLAWSLIKSQRWSPIVGFTINRSGITAWQVKTKETLDSLWRKIGKKKTMVQFIICVHYFSEKATNGVSHVSHAHLHEVLHRTFPLMAALQHAVTQPGGDGYSTNMTITVLSCMCLQVKTQCVLWVTKWQI
jgi:hypothetical protein